MMKYIEISVFFDQNIDDDNSGVVVAELGDMGCESFTEQDNVLNCYIQKPEFDKFQSQIETYLKDEHYQYKINEIENINWNSVWESNFEPIEVNDDCYIRAPFHDPKPNCKYDILIMPKMSFGTGHHSTTFLMIEQMLQMDLAGRVGADLGCGTGVLAILASKMGAAFVDAIDIDEWAYENTKENIVANHTQHNISPILGDANALRTKTYDFILANINRNILLNDMSIYADNLKQGGDILFSGFLSIDNQIIIDKASSLGLNVVSTRTKEGWMLVHCRKE